MMPMTVAMSPSTTMIASWTASERVNPILRDFGLCMLSPRAVEGGEVCRPAYGRLEVKADLSGERTRRDVMGAAKG